MIPIAFDAEGAPAKSKFILLVVVRQFCCLALEYVKTNLAGSVMLAMAHFTPFEIGHSPRQSPVKKTLICLGLCRFRSFWFA